MNPWITWASQPKAISKIGTAHTRDAYDLERYQQLSRIAHELLARLADAPLALGRVDNFFIADKGHAAPKVDL